MNHEILIETEVDGAEPYAGLLRRVIPAALEAEGVSFPCEVDVLFTDDEGIHAINLEQRGVDRPTDVLSFPMFQLTPGAPPTLDDVEADPGTGLVPLGDMVLSLERAEAQGAEYGHGAEREAAYLAVHSVLRPAGLRPPGRGPDEGPDAGAGGGHPGRPGHHPGGRGWIRGFCGTPPAAGRSPCSPAGCCAWCWARWRAEMWLGWWPAA